MQFEIKWKKNRACYTAKKKNNKKTNQKKPNNQNNKETNKQKTMTQIQKKICCLPESV